MADLSYVLYDTFVMGNVASFEQVLFQVTQGADAAHTESFTNARGAGQLPSGERFSIDWIGVMNDFNGAIADYLIWSIGSFLEIRVSDLTVFKAPLGLLVANSAFGGHYSQAAAADEALIGRMGSGYKLAIPIEIEGGTQFRVRMFQSLALSAASLNNKVLLGGTLSLPG